MRITHLNAGSMCMRGGEWSLGKKKAGTPIGSALVCHCLLIETNTGLILVDTGLGLDDVHAESHRPVRRVVKTLGAVLSEQETVIRQIEAMGYERDDVQHIVLTHLDVDHAGGLPDFPNAKVHVYAGEHAAAVVERRIRERQRYSPTQWAHGPDWRLYETQGESWFGFDCVRQLEGLPPDILLVPLLGHTRGHCAVAVNRGDRWLLHAGDAYFFHEEMNAQRPYCPPGLRLFQTFAEVNRGQRLGNQARLRALAQEQAGKVEVFCAHDATEWQRMVDAQQIEEARLSA